MTQARLALADIYRRKGKLDLAKGHLEKVLEKEPENIQVLNALTDIADPLAKGFDVAPVAEKALAAAGSQE